MHEFTKNVVRSARERYETAPLEVVGPGGSATLATFFTSRVGWWPNPAVVPAPLIVKWVADARARTYDIVKAAWDANRNRINLAVLCELWWQLAEYGARTGRWDESQIALVASCEELGSYDLWPELRDVRKVYPAPVVLPARLPVRPVGSTAQQVFAVNEGIYGPQNAGMAVIWKRSADESDRLFRENERWIADQAHQRAMRNKP